jgi:hypothetical protein
MHEQAGLLRGVCQQSKILSRGASASDLVKEKPTQDFGIERGVWQECHLVPYLILLVGEALNAII